MGTILTTRNKIIFFEITLLMIMLLISYKIYILEEGLIKLSKDKNNILFSIHILEHEVKDTSFLSKDYIFTKNKKFKKKYFNIINNGYGLEVKIKNKQLYNNFQLNELSYKEKLEINQLFKVFSNLLNVQQNAIKLFDENKMDKIKQTLLFQKIENLKQQIFHKLHHIVKETNKRIDGLFLVQKSEVYRYFILLATIGTLFVLINIYFFIYLTNIAIKQLNDKINLIKKVEHFNDTLEDKVEQRTTEIKRLMKVKSEFLANMSHEIRTPLNAMFGFIRILQEKDLDNESKKFLNVIEKSGQNLLTIINDVLDFSKIEAGKLHIEKVEFNPKEEIEVIYNLFNGIASEKNITLKVNENLKYNIISDPVRLKQVMANLLSNAIKFSKTGTSITLNINYSKDTSKLYVEVIDEGIGISEDKIEHIFEAFSQADNSTTRKYGGTGLGLTISYKLIELLGGELKAESEVGKGSKFYFTIPSKSNKKIKEEEVIEKKSAISNKQFNGHILLVEDNKANQMFMKVILQKMGLEFDIANDGIEALKKFEELKYDVILMDENMPNMNGIEATKKIREIEKEKQLDHTPIIALTANVMEGDKEKFIQSGMNFYLSKPLDIEKLQDILEKI